LFGAVAGSIETCFSIVRPPASDPRSCSQRRATTAPRGLSGDTRVLALNLRIESGSLVLGSAEGFSK
jgi:hypothetical protein